MATLTDDPMNDDLIFLCYGSSAVDEFEPGELESMLRGARTRNTARNITGCLLYRDGNFLQMLEGSRSVVLPLFEKIKEDSRHGGVLRLLEKDLDERLFADWSMGFRDMSEDDEGAYSDLLDGRAEAAEYFEILPAWVLSLIGDFQRVNR